MSRFTEPVPPHDPLDELIAAALQGDLSPQERADFDTRLQTDPAARAAYQEAQAMHDLLDHTHRNAQPDPRFEERMVSGVHQKLENAPRETAWGSMVALWSGVKLTLNKARTPLPRILVNSVAILMICAILAGIFLGPITSGLKQA
jgi:anti-sigma factor RsiW